MEKKVSVRTAVRLFLIKNAPPLFGECQLTLKQGEIKTAILAGATVKEIGPNGEMVRLTLENFDKENFSVVEEVVAAPVVVETPVVVEEVVETVVEETIAEVVEETPTVEEIAVVEEVVTEVIEETVVEETATEVDSIVEETQTDIVEDQPVVDQQQSNRRRR